MDNSFLNGLPAKLDLLILKDQLNTFKNPNKKIFDLVQKKYLFSISRGVYLNLRSDSLKNLSIESIANSFLIPSYISAEWALQFYGLLTDRATVVTSVTFGQEKQYATPIGLFKYERIKKSRYPVGYVSLIINNNIILIATPVKALVDYISLRFNLIKKISDINLFITDDLRLHLHDMIELCHVDEIVEIQKNYHRNSNEFRILAWLKIKKQEGKNE